MRNIRLLLEYDGTGFHGWQRQKDVRSVQGEVEAAIERIFHQACDVFGAGRTDTGVHAIGYVCNFHVDTEMPARRMLPALQAHLPGDVAVKRVEDAPAAFHARFDALSRRYAYHVATEPTALWRHCRLQTRFCLDAAAMDRAARHLRGEHDFTSFTPATNDANPVCNVMEVGVGGGEGLVKVEIEANRFLHHMVRVITGTLMEVGRGQLSPEQIPVILGKKDRTAAGPTAPPTGLVLVAVRYPGDDGNEESAGAVHPADDVL
jgi:tRNA pseudouridine38-40 synthase